MSFEDSSPVVSDEDALETTLGELELEVNLSELEGTLGAGPEEEKEPRPRKRMVSLRFAVLLTVLAVAGTALALNNTLLPIELLETFSTQYAATDFSITTFDTRPAGNNRLTIDVTLQNNGAAPHFANVTVYLLNASGVDFLNATQATGAVAPAGSVGLSFVFTQANVVPTYENAMVVVDQSS